MRVFARRGSVCPVLNVLCLAFVLALGTHTLAQGVAPDAATPEQQKQAQTRYEQGVQHYKAGRFAEAVDAFKSSVDIVASPNARLMYARALRENGNIEEAYEQLALTQHEASELAVRLPKYASAGENAETEMTALLKKTAALRVDITGAEPRNVRLTVGEREVSRKHWFAVAVKPGTHEVTASATSGARASHTVEAAAGQITRVELDLSVVADKKEARGDERPKSDSDMFQYPEERDRGVTEAEHPMRPLALVLSGIGLVGLVTFAIAGSMSRNTYATLEDECPNMACEAEHASDIDRGKTEQTVANVGLAVGVVGLVAGVTLFVIDPGSTEPKTGQKAIRLAVGARSVNVAGSF